MKAGDFRNVISTSIAITTLGAVGGLALAAYIQFRKDEEEEPGSLGRGRTLCMIGTSIAFIVPVLLIVALFFTGGSL